MDIEPDDLAGLLLAIAAAVGLGASINAWFDWRSGIQGEPGTMLVIVACALILIGLVVAIRATSTSVRGLFNALIMLATILTGVAAWFLMSWTLLGAMIVAAVAQAARLTRKPRIVGTAQ